MRNPENVLISLIKHSNKKDYKYERLYRLLYNEEMYLIAYQNIYSNDGSMTKGTDHKTVDGMSMERIQKIILSLKDESYQPKHHPDERAAEQLDGKRQGTSKC